jgi:hypothetical protein
LGESLQLDKANSHRKDDYTWYKLRQPAIFFGLPFPAFSAHGLALPGAGERETEFAASKVAFDVG